MNVLDFKAKPICSIKNKKLKISYNELKPYFSVKNSEILKDTIEGVVIQSFIDKNNLTTELKNENFKWGRKNENGTFDGVVGRVRYCRMHDILTRSRLRLLAFICRLIDFTTLSKLQVNLVLVLILYIPRLDMERQMSG